MNDALQNKERKIVNRKTVKAEKKTIYQSQSERIVNP